MFKSIQTGKNVQQTKDLLSSVSKSRLISYGSNYPYMNAITLDLPVVNKNVSVEGKNELSHEHLYTEMGYNSFVPSIRDIIPLRIKFKSS